MKALISGSEVRTGGYFLDLGSSREGEAVLRCDHPTHGPGWLLFDAPTEIICARSIEDVKPMLAEVERKVEEGRHSVGFLSYEASGAFEPKIVTRAPGVTPLGWFALYSEPPSFWRELAPQGQQVPLSDLKPELGFDYYGVAFNRVKEELAAGTTYQVNLTFRTTFELKDSAYSFFASRCGVNPPPFAAFIHGGDWEITSFSPELFFEREGTRVSMKPMKGTAPISGDKASTLATAVRLANDTKTIAENLMIVDMVRNDLGRVAQTGTVSTSDLMKVERHGNILQVTSGVSADVPCSTADLLSSIFPPASVTGAPKISTCAHIEALEVSPRGIYCGAIGFLSPGSRARFSVAIRTAMVQGGCGEYGVGSGLVWDSEVRSEYEECLLKTDVLCARATPWRLLEAIHADSLSSPTILDAHFARLSRSAAHFGVPLDLDALRLSLCNLSGGLTKGDLRGPKVRVAVNRDGSFELSVGSTEIGKQTLSAVLARSPICIGDPNLRHKTSSRSQYEFHLDQAPDFDEVLLFNLNGNVTEFCRGNVIARLDGRLVSPAPECGCLAGVGVGQMVARGEVEFGTISVERVMLAADVYFVNAVTGMIPVKLQSP